MTPGTEQHCFKRAAYATIDIVLQSGEVIDDRDLKAYQTSSIVDNEEMYSDAAALIRYFTELYLTSDDQPQNLTFSRRTLDGN